MAEADRHLEEEMEEERKKAEVMARERQERLGQFQRDYRVGLDQQRMDQDALRLIEFEQREQELAVRKCARIKVQKIYFAC